MTPFPAALLLGLTALAPVPLEERPAQARSDTHGDPLPAGAVARLGTVRLRHGGDFHREAVAFSPDGRLLAVGGQAGPIVLWDAATGKEVRALRGHEKADNPYFFGFSAAFSRDGKWLITGSGEEKGAFVWDVATGVVVRRLQGHEGAVVGVALSPDGKTLATAGRDGTVRLWDLAAGRDQRRWQAHERGAVSLAFAPDGKSLVSGGHDDAIRCWDVAGGKERWSDRPELSRFGPLQLAFTPDGKEVISGDKLRTIRFWDVQTGRLTRTLVGEAEDEEHARKHSDLIRAVAISHDGKTLYSGGWDGLVRVWDLAAGKEVKRWRWPHGQVQGLALSQDGQKLAVSDDGQKAHLIDLATDADLLPLSGHAGRVDLLAFGADGKTLATLDRDAVCVWSPAEGKLLRRRPLPEHRGLCDLSADGRLLALQPRKGERALLYDLATGKEVGRIDGFRARLYGLALSPDGRTAAVGDSDSDDDNSLRVWDVAAGKELARITGAGLWPEHLAVSPDGKTAAASLVGGRLALFDLARGKEARELLPLYTAHVNALAFTPDGKRLATAEEDRDAPFGSNNFLRLWDVGSGKASARLKAAEGRISSLVFARDGKRLAFANVRGEVVVWDLAADKERHRFRGHRGSVGCLRFSPDGKLLASGGSDTTALVWDVSGGP
jgi:WD40 repeat protein